jgi:hypothetical protein
MGDCFAKYARNDMNRWMPFVTNLILIIFLNRPSNGALLFVLDAIERFLCHGFMLACYDVCICKVIMNRINTNPQTASFAMNTASQSDASTPLRTSPVPFGRLIVLIPLDSDYSGVTRRVWELAITTGKHVQLLGLCKDMAQEPSLRRQLITMAALIGDSKVFTEAKVEIGANWVEAVKRNYQTGDMIVCFTEQRAGHFQKPLNQILEASLDAPIYILSGLYAQRPSRFNVLSFIPLWAGLISIIAVAFLLQAQIISLPLAWTQTTLLILSVIAEFWLIWFWNNLFS